MSFSAPLIKEKTPLEYLYHIQTFFIYCKIIGHCDSWFNLLIINELT
jgi:hypothetical protein